MRLSVVLPLYNESDNLEVLYARLTATLDRIACDYELIFVDDGSTDGSVRILDRLVDEDARVRYLSLSRNFGHEIASSAGLDMADGDAVVLMDADLQDPPELIERLLEPWLQGYDVVCARRTRRHGESMPKRVAAFLFYRLMRRLCAVDLPVDTGDFRLMDRRVVDALRRFSESHRFVRGLVSWMGFRQTCVEYERSARHAGVGKYSCGQLIKLAVDALLSFSTVPLRLASTIGAACTMTGAFFAAASLWSGTGGAAPSTGSNSLLLLLAGAQLLAIGVLGEYIGRMHRDVMRRPLYLVDRQRGWRRDAGMRRPMDSFARDADALRRRPLPAGQEAA